MQGAQYLNAWRPHHCGGVAGASTYELSDEDMNAQLISDELLRWFAESCK